MQDTFRPYSRRCPTLRWKESRGHLTWLEYRDVFERRGENIRDYTLMTVVRNPWAWHVSWYNYVRNDIGGRRSGLKIEHEQFRRMSFEQYLRWLDDEAAPQSPQGYVRMIQADWISDEAGNVMVDEILRQESLQDDIRSLVDRLNLAVTPVHKRVNVSTRDDYRSYYTPDGVDQIAKRHQRDIELFGYSFADARNAPS